MVCVLLGYLGAQPPEGIYVIAGRILTFCYFAYFLILLPLLEPDRNAAAAAEFDRRRRAGEDRKQVGADGVDRDRARARRRAVRRQRAERPGRRSSAMPPSQKWSFAGPFGKYDRGSLQRGLKVYKEVCSACHSLNYIAFRNLADPGGPGYSEAQVAAFASDYKIKDGPNDQGEMFDRPGRPADYFPSPFPNEQAARAANGGAAAARPVADHQGAFL